MNRPVLALLPPFHYHTSIEVEADVYAVRFPCQIDAALKGHHDFIYFDQFIDQQLAQRHNEKAVFESLKHTSGMDGDCSEFKGLSLVDIDHANIYTSAFLHCYREGLAFLSLIERMKPSKVIVAEGDSNLDILESLSYQAGLPVEKVPTFGTIDPAITDLIRSSNRGLDIQNHVFHGVYVEPLWKKFAASCINFLSKFIEKKGALVFLDHHGQLTGIRDSLCERNEFRPVFFSVLRLRLRNLISSGFLIANRTSKIIKSRDVSETIEKYLCRLKKLREENTVGKIESGEKEFTIFDSIHDRLTAKIPVAFQQIAANIDRYGEFVNTNGAAGALLSSDMNWENRMIVRLLQKHEIPNMVLMNGWFGTRHMVENKSADKALCFGNSYPDHYFSKMKDVKTVGSPKCDNAYKKRGQFKPRYPIKNILVSTFTFSPADINCHYRDHENYIQDVLNTIRKYSERNGREFQIALRPHPSDSPLFYTWLLKRLGFADVKLVHGGEFQDIAMRYDLYIASYSTTLLETASMGIPVLFYHPCNQLLYPPFDGSCEALPAAFSREDLGEIFSRLATDRDYAYAFTKEAILDPFTGILDGNSTDRILAEILEMVQKQKTGAGKRH